MKVQPRSTPFFETCERTAVASTAWATTMVVFILTSSLRQGGVPLIR